MIGNKKQESGEDKEKRIYCDYGCRGRSWKDSHADTMLQSGDKTKKQPSLRVQIVSWKRREFREQTDKMKNDESRTN